jgi:hypothetical protein
LCGGTSLGLSSVGLALVAGAGQPLQEELFASSGIKQAGIKPTMNYMTKV